jgi:hypothetical protein
MSRFEVRYLYITLRFGTRRSRHVMQNLPSRKKRNIRILLVDFDRMSAQLLAHTLVRRRYGVRVRTLVGASEDVIRRVGPCRENVAVIRANLRDGYETGLAVLKFMPSNGSTYRPAGPKTASIVSRVS